jgi:hypothetical protein
MEYDRSGFEQGKIVLFISRDPTEGMKREMRRFLHLGKRQKSNWT